MRRPPPAPRAADAHNSNHPSAGLGSGQELGSAAAVCSAGAVSSAGASAEHAAADADGLAPANGEAAGDQGESCWAGGARCPADASAQVCACPTRSAPFHQCLHAFSLGRARSLAAARACPHSGALRTVMCGAEGNACKI